MALVELAGVELVGLVAEAAVMALGEAMASELEAQMA